MHRELSLGLTFLTVRPKLELQEPECRSFNSQG
jgi:hypothetical protein